MIKSKSIIADKPGFCQAEISAPLWDGSSASLRVPCGQRADYYEDITGEYLARCEEHRIASYYRQVPEDEAWVIWLMVV
jgi:hypothetical protein